MANYTTSAKVITLSNNQITSVESDWIQWVSSEIDTMLNTDFSLKDEVYYIQMRESTNKILLKTPLFPVDISNAVYANDINTDSKTYVYNNLSPIIYIKEHDTEFPPLTSSTPLIEGKDYYVNKASINRIIGTFKQFVEIRFAWGYSSIPADIQMLATLMTTEFALSQQSTSEAMSERIGDYQYTSYKDATTSGFADNIVNLKSTTLNKYALTSIASTSGVLSNRGILIDEMTPLIGQTVSLPNTYSG